MTFAEDKTRMSARQTFELTALLGSFADQRPAGDCEGSDFWLTMALNGLKSRVAHAVAQLPSHQAFLDEYLGDAMTAR